MMKRFLILVATLGIAYGEAIAKSDPEPAASPNPASTSYYYGYYPTAYKHAQKLEIGTPACADNTTKLWCLEDDAYPEYEIKHAASYHHFAVLALYKDVAVNTENSVERPTTLEEETYLCPSDTSYVQPLRAVNTAGKWRVIVNNVEVRYKTLTQSARLEECLTSGDACPLVPVCYETSCLQKSVYHRFLVYDPYDYYFPFAIETFKLPASCSCLIGAYSI